METCLIILIVYGSVFLLMLAGLILTLVKKVNKKISVALLFMVIAMALAYPVVVHDYAVTCIYIVKNGPCGSV